MCGDAARRLRGYGDSRLRVRSWRGSRRVWKTGRVEVALAIGAFEVIATVASASKNASRWAEDNAVPHRPLLMHSRRSVETLALMAHLPVVVARESAAVARRFAR